MLYGFGTTELYNSSTLIQANIWQRIQVISIILFNVSFFYFIINFFKSDFWRKYFWYLFGFAMLTIIPQVFLYQPAIWNTRKSIIHLINFFGSPQIINESQPGIVTQITFGIGIISFVFLLILVIHEFRHENNPFGHPLFISTIILFTILTHDALVGIGVFNSIYLLEVGFLIVIGILAFMLSKNIIGAIEIKEALEKANYSLQIHKEELEKIVFDRTQAYQYQAKYFQALVDNNPIATVTLDNNQQINSVNPAFEELFGYSQQEAIGKDLDSIIAPEGEIPLAKELTEKVLKNQQVYEKGTRRNKDGKLVNVEISGVPVYVNNDLTGVLGLYRDISDQIKTEKVLQESEMRYRSLFEDSPISLWEEDFSLVKKEIEKFNKMGVKNFHEFFHSNLDVVTQLMEKVQIINVNQATIRLFKAQSKADFMNGISNLILSESIESNGKIYASLAEGGNQYIGEIHHKDFLGNNIYTVLRLAIAPGYEDTWEKVFISVIDITERKNNESYLEYLSTHDQLTGVANRSLLYDRLNHAIELAKRENKIVAVLFLDLDGFKSINDLFGHLVGDQLLIKIAERMQANIRSADTIARFGGDEFILVLEKLQDKNDIFPITEKILKTVEDPYEIQGYNCQVTTSIGISIFPFDAETSEDLINKADTAMYRAKQLGKNQYKFFGFRT